MKRLVISALVLVGMLGTADAATRPTGGVNNRGGGTTTSAPSTASAARSAVSARSAKPTAAPAAAQSNTSQRTTVQRGQQTASTGTTANVGRSATVSARAGATQKVIGTGTKVAAAAQNIVVSEACKQKYEGCMDSFCMMENASGGRCICSDRNAELNTALAEIEKLDQQSYQMATFGVEKIEMGSDAEQAIANANAAAQSVIKNQTEEKKATARRKLDMSMWNTSVSFDDEDIFSSSEVDPIDGKEGDALHRAAADICFAQIPECASEKSLLQMMYAQRIKSDCTAYENSLKQQKTASQQKLMAAEQALREAALDQLRTANKYDLGQCTVEFKKCMITTGGCGEDFSQCASVVASDSTNVRQSTSKKAKNYTIKGTVTNIEISASTYDTLESKKPLCASITNSCVAVKDQVWDTFLREVAPQIKNAELIAEDNARQNCIGNISSCFQKACKDTIDPKDPDGSYDMCLSRPETMLNLCKVPLNACGIDASSAEKAQESQIWDFVTARLAAMRVDSCTTEVKACLQADDRCGKDYSNCIGLDTDTIVRMCPYDKLVGCQKVYGETEIRGNAVYDELSTMVQGIILNIDNNMLTECQRAADEAMIKVCGDTESCNGLTVDENIGARSLEYKICEFSYDESKGYMDINYNKCRPTLEQISDDELAGPVLDSNTGERGPGINIASAITGMIYWDTLDNTNNSSSEDAYNLLNADEYIAKVEQQTGHSMSAGEKANIREKVSTEIRTLQKAINDAISTIESDTTVQFCMTGRNVQGMRTNDGTRRNINSRGEDSARFPELTKQMRKVIAAQAIKAAKTNYYKKYDELNAQMLQDYSKVGERLAQIRKEDSLNARREAARVACVSFATASILATSPNPPKNAFGQILSSVITTASTVAMAIGTGGASSAITGAMDAVKTAKGAFDTAKAVVSGVGAVAKASSTLAGGIAASKGFDQSGGGNGEASGLVDGDLGDKQLIGSRQLNQWNYKETITSTFEWDTLVCHKCSKKQNCKKTKNPLFGRPYCGSWTDAVEECTDTQF